MFWIAFSLVIVYFISMVINIAPNRSILNYGYMEQCMDFIKNLLPAVIMGACVYQLSFLNMRPIIMLVVQILVGVGIYLLISIVSKNESFKMLLKIVKQALNSYRKRKNGGAV